MARKNNISESAKNDIAASKAASRKEAIQKGLMPKVKSWGGKDTPKIERKRTKNELRNGHA